RCRERAGSSRGRGRQPRRGGAAVISEQRLGASTTPASFELPVTSRQLLNDPASLSTVAVESRYANGDLITLLDTLGIAGPFTVESPWELRDDQGRHLLHAGGYAAVPFGERYQPLVEFVGAYLENGRQLAFAQQSASEWRAALSHN